MNSGNIDLDWVDPDDAPEMTKEDLARGVWAINGKVVSQIEGKTAFAQKLREIKELGKQEE
jgi:hypothetical protein